MSIMSIEDKLEIIETKIDSHREDFESHVATIEGNHLQLRDMLIRIETILETLIKELTELKIQEEPWNPKTF